MRKIFYLSSCDTCQRILNDLKLLDDFLLQDVKNEPITEQQLDELKEIIGRYELLFNKRAKLYRERELHQQPLTEEDYKKLILEHYTFLKRPILVIDQRIISGNATKIIKEVRKFL
ncbi:MAG: ArsC/Spx/MgsR family protein [Capnocytophaga sp.]|nr:ArsC/Spx/MgsR family protein [Capnocytophaga sp.]